MFNRNSKEIPLKTPGSGVDFHMHTLASDGLWTPEKLVDTAYAQGVQVMTVSDHDTIKNVRPVQQLAARRGITFIPGVEITISWQGKMYHMLAFNFNPDDAGLNALLDDTEAQRVAKQEGMIEGLKKMGFHLNKLAEYTDEDGKFSSTDVARALHRGGECANFDQAIQLCVKFGLDKICSQAADKAIKTVVAAGGVPVLAHPGRREHGFEIATLDVLPQMVEFGLAGVEAYHYSHQPATVEQYLQFARQHELVVSAGSDSHNEARKPTPWNPELTRALLERFNLDRPAAFSA